MGKTVTIKIILNSKTDSFGTKTIIFIAKEGGTFFVTRDEGLHSEIEIGKIVVDAVKHESGDCTL